jgi:small-conductance mechanosensitive channel
MEQLGDSALMLRLYCFIDEVGKGVSTRSEMYVEIVRRFAEAGIAIPFPQRDIHMIGEADT